jgi:hypothetical protein
MSNNQQETLEEAAEKYAEIYRCPATNKNEYCRHDIISAINFGAKWQQEQAKEMHKQEIIEFSKKCLDKALDLDVRTSYSKIEQYYNETYGKSDV